MAGFVGGDYLAMLLATGVAERDGVVLGMNLGTNTEVSKDVSEIQLAKGAMRAGVYILLKHAGVTDADNDELIVAGAFGTYLDIQSGLDIGMFPKVNRDKIHQVGNAAGAGAHT